MKKRVLVIDDEEHILELLKINLEFSGYDVYTLDTGKNAVDKVKEILPDLILLDLMLPEESGVEICRKIRSDKTLNKIRILILSAKSDELDKVLCLEMGADDYVTKPFSLRELMVRIKAIFRRTDPEFINYVSTNEENKIENEKILKYKDLELDLKKGEIYRAGERIELTTKEFKLFLFLLNNKGKVLNRDEIIENVWKHENSTSRSLDVHIRKLRMKLNDNNNEYIETVRGTGYLVPLD